MAEFPPTGGPPDSLPKIPGQPEKNPLAEAYAAGMAYSPESLNTELISHAASPVELYYGLREREEFKDYGLTAASLGNDYRDPSLFSAMFERWQTLRKTPAELQRRGWLVFYDEASGMGVLRSKRFGAQIIDREKVAEVQLPDGGTVMAVDIGTPERRAGMEEAYKNAKLEFSSRTTAGEQIGVLLNLNVRDDLGTLVDWQHGMQSTFKPEHLQSIFNMPSIRELEQLSDEQVTPKEIKEKRELGDQTEEATLLYLIMLKSGSKQDMQDLLARPGAQYLVSKLAKEEEARRQEAAPEGTTVTYTREQWVSEFVGDVDNWVDDMDRDIKTWRTERNDRSGVYATREFGKRGRLTKWANICAFAGDPGEMSTDEETHFIENEIGEAVGSVEASWVAATLLRDIGAFASEGYIALPNGKSYIPLGEFRYLTSDDRGKFFPYMFDIKEGFKNRSSGLGELIYRVPDMGMNLLDWAQVQVDGMYEKDETGALITNDKGEPKIARRSVWDAWLGTAEQPKKDIVTGKYAEYGIQEANLDLKDDADKELVKNGKFVLIEGPHPKHGQNEKFYVSKEDADKINNGKKSGKEYDDIPNNQKARLVEIEDPETHVKRQQYMTIEDAEKIKNGGAILIREKSVKDGSTRVFYGKKVQAEGYHRLGSLNWGSLERYFHGTFGTMQWLMGRERGGVLTEARNVEDFSAADFTLRKLKMMSKYNGITLNAITLTKGSPHLYDMGTTTVDGVRTYDLSDISGGSLTFHEVQTTGTETIQRTFLKNVIAARVHTSNWILNIMPKRAEAYNLAKVGGNFYDEVPLSNVLELFAKEVLKEFPRTEEELLAHYVDDLNRIQGQTDKKQPLVFYKETARWLKNPKSRLVGVRRGRTASHTYALL